MEVSFYKGGWRNRRHSGHESGDIDTSTWTTSPHARKWDALKAYGESLRDCGTPDDGAHAVGNMVKLSGGKYPTVKVKNGDLDGWITAAIEKLIRNSRLSTVTQLISFLESTSSLMGIGRNMYLHKTCQIFDNSDMPAQTHSETPKLSSHPSCRGDLSRPP